jgi:hypothetical protein
MGSRPLPEGGAAVMGMKIRRFSPLPGDLSLEDLIPVNHLYLRLEEA